MTAPFCAQLGQKLRVCVLGAFFFFSPLSADPNAHFPKPCRIRVRHIESGGVGYNTGYTTLEAFLSGDPNSWKITPFFDGRAHLFDNGTWAANGGLGLRSQLGNRIYGINTYYDYRGTKHLNYNQAGIGLESLGTLVDARINGYFPFGKKISSPYDTKFGYFSGHDLILSQRVEVAMKGVDAEAGFHVGNCDSWMFYAALGPYYFRGPDGPNAWGGKVRASVSYRDWVAFEAIETYDNVFHNHVQGQIAFSIPLGRKDKERRADSLYCRKIQPIARNEIIVLDHKRKHPIAIDPATGSPYFFVFVNNTSSSEGTFESPYPSLVQAQNNSVPNQIIYVFPGDGTTKNMEHGIVLQASQKRWGSATTHTLQTSQGSVTIPQMSASAPQITNIDLHGVGATLSTHNEISGLIFTQTNGSAISGVDPLEITLSDCTILGSGQGGAGIYPVRLQANSPFTATIYKNTISDNTNAGIFIQLLSGASSAEIVMNNNQAFNNQTNTGSSAILNIEPHGSVGACELVMSNNNFQSNQCGACTIADLDTPNDGSFTSFQGTFTENIFIENAQGIAFAANADACSMLIQNNDLSNNTNGSISVLAGPAGTQSIYNATIDIDSNQANYGGNGGDAITISPSGNTIAITISNNSISNNLGTAFVSFFSQPGSNATLSIYNNAIANNQNIVNFNASGGISFDGFKSVSASIENNTLSNNERGSIIGLYGGSWPPNTSTVTFTNNQLSGGDTFDFEFFGNTPSTGCLTISGNTSALNPSYTFQQQGSGACFIVPCNYNALNTGGFTLSGASPSADCSGNSCH